MRQHSKKIISVLFAILLGAGIIFIALKAGAPVYTDKSPSISESMEWRNSLSVIPSEVSLNRLGATQTKGKNTATTTTDIVARELLINYVAAQSGMSTTTMSDAEAIAIAQVLVEKIELPRAREYSLKDLSISNNNSKEAFALYEKNIVSITSVFGSAQERSDIEVAFTAPTSQNERTRNAAISKNVAHYEELAQSLLLANTPSLVAPLHLLLIQKYANIQALIKPMSEIYSDPLRGLRALSQYKNEVATLPALAMELSSFLSKNK